MKFVDSNVLAYAFYKNQFQEESQKAIRQGGVINTLNLIEAFNVIEKMTNRELASKAIKNLMKANFKIIDVNINIVFEALKRNDKYSKLKIANLIHYTTALFENCESIITYDADFDKLDIPREEP